MKIASGLLLLLFASTLALSQTPAGTLQSPANGSGGSAIVANTTKPAILPELDRLETAASQITVDIGKLRIEKWKTGSVAKSAAKADADSVQRNLASALPGLIASVRAAPENLNAEFKLYRNLNALCDVVGSLTAAARAFGPNNDYEAVAQQLQVLGSVRRTMGDSLDQLSAAQQQELDQARIQIKTQQEQLAAAAAAPPRETVVAQTEPPKKPAPKKKTVSKKSATPGSAPSSSSPSQTTAGNTSPKS